MRGGQLAVIAASKLAGAIVTLVILTTDVVEELQVKSLLFHMMPEHFLFATAGFLLPSGLEDLARLVMSSRRQSLRHTTKVAYSAFLRYNAALNPAGVPGLLISALILTYWHIPEFFDAATLDPDLHAQMHIQYTVLGTLIFMSLKKISKGKTAILGVALGKVMGVGGVYLAVSQTPVYTAYPLSQNLETGFVMLILMAVHDVAAVAYLVHSLMSSATRQAVRVAE